MVGLASVDVAKRGLNLGIYDGPALPVRFVTSRSGAVHENDSSLSNDGKQHALYKSKDKVPNTTSFHLLALIGGVNQVTPKAVVPCGFVS